MAEAVKKYVIAANNSTGQHEKFTFQAWYEIYALTGNYTFVNIIEDAPKVAPKAQAIAPKKSSCCGK
jgi:hypothetical protein